MWAISPRGIGKPVGARAVTPGMPLVVGETFRAVDWSRDKVLAEDGVSLRLGTVDELDTEKPKRDKISQLKQAPNKSVTVQDLIDLELI